jgi:hypothetical protein
MAISAARLAATSALISTTIPVRSESASAYARRANGGGNQRRPAPGEPRDTIKGVQSREGGKQRGFGVRPASSLELHFEAILLLGEARDELLRLAFDRVECLHQLLAARA